MTALLATIAITLLVAATLLLGSLGLRLTRTTSDLLVASRGVGTLWNASAVAGEYLSAASFLGVAGLVLVYGSDALWYPVGYAAGYLVLLAFVSAPLRRSGAYTLADFTAVRLGSPLLRRAAALVTVLIGWLYLLPQLQGAGLTLQTVTGASSWVGAVAVATVVGAALASGGMRSTTQVQAMQYAVKLAAVSVTAVVALLAWHHSGAPALTRPRNPTFQTRTTVTFDAPATLHLTAPADHTIQVRTGTSMTFAAGTVIPDVSSGRVSTGAIWARPLAGAGGRAHPLYTTYAVIIALLLGTMGLPHVLVRFYANVDGRAARRTALTVLVLLGAFYISPAILGALGRVYTPDLLLSGHTDAVVLLLPTRIVGGLAGQALGALVAAGAFAAFLSTSLGLVFAVSGTLSHDLFARAAGSVRGFRVSALAATLLPLGLALVVPALPAGVLVTLAFSLAASTLAPLLLLGIWWRRLTVTGALAGLATGAVLAGGAASATVVGSAGNGWWGAVLSQPAAITAPLAFAVMVMVSLTTRALSKQAVTGAMALMHAPELSVTTTGR